MHGIESIRQPYGFGSFVSKAFKKIGRGVKKVIKSPVGRMALLGGLGAYGASQGMFGPGAQGFMKSPGKWGKIMSMLKGTEATNVAGLPITQMGKPGILSGALKFIGKNKLPLAIAGGVGLGTGLMAGKGEEEIDRNNNEWWAKVMRII